MGAGFIRETELFPDAGPVELDVLNVDGDYVLMGKTHAEVNIKGPRADGKTLVISLRFPTWVQAQRAGELLQYAFGEARRISTEEIPDSCDHYVMEVRWAREIDKHRICRLCHADLGLVPR